MAEDNGLKAAIEKGLADGQGSVDVEVIADSMSVACELSISTDKQHEIGNISKCLTAGYSHILAICSDRARLAKLRKAAIAALPAESLKRVSFVSMVGALTFLQGLRTPSKSTGIDGWDVRALISQSDESAEDRSKQFQSGCKSGMLRATLKKSTILISLMRGYRRKRCGMS